MDWSDITGAFGNVVKDPKTWGALAGIWAGAQGSEDQAIKPYYVAGQEQGLVDVMGLAQQEYEAGPQQFYPGQQLAGLDPNTISGQNMALGAVPLQQQLADIGTFGTANLMQGGAGRVDGFQLPDQVGFGIDPGLEDAVMNPIMRNLEERVLPGIDLAATSQGAFGGTRQALQKGQAAANASEQAAEAVARANLTARQQSIGQRSGDVNAMLSGRGQDIQQNSLENQAVSTGIRSLPGMMGAQLTPASTMMDVGQQRTGYEQALINADKARWDFNQAAPIDALTRLQERVTLSGSPQGRVVEGQDGSWLNMLGGAMTGINAVNAFSGGGGSTSESDALQRLLQGWGAA